MQKVILHKGKGNGTMNGNEIGAKIILDDEIIISERGDKR